MSTNKKGGRSSGGYGSRSATLKGKLDQLQDMATELAKEMQFSKK